MMQDTPINKPTIPQTIPTEDSEEIDAGEALYKSKGCPTCHGLRAEGGIGPALAGHTPEEIVDQVRRPLGVMPAFSASTITDAELEAIITFILSLAGTATLDDGRPGGMDGDMMDGAPTNSHMH